MSEFTARVAEFSAEVAARQAEEQRSREPDGFDVQVQREAVVPT